MCLFCRNVPCELILALVWLGCLEESKLADNVF
jgi:hypothetical protein